MVNCVANNAGAIGYVNASRTGNFYNVPLEGVDPDTNDLRTLVACGLYRFWGPLAGAETTTDQSDLKDAHKKAIASSFVFPAGDDYVPFGSVAFRKDNADNLYYLGFLPPATCPGAINPPALSIP